MSYTDAAPEYGVGKQDQGPTDTQTFQQREGFGALFDDAPGWAQALENAPLPSQILAPPPSLQASPSTNPQTAFSDPAYLRQIIEEDRAASKEARAALRENAEGTRSELEAGLKDINETPLPQLERSPRSPQANLGQGAMEWMQIASLIGALGGAFSRGNTTTALTAFGSAVKGFTQGKQQAFEDGMEEWKAATERVREDNQAKMDTYKLIWQRKELNIQQKMALRKMVAEQYQDEISYNLAEQGKYEQLAMFDTKMEQLTALNDAKVKNLGLQGDKLAAQVQLLQAFGGNPRSPQFLSVQAKMMDYFREHGERPPPDMIQKWVADAAFTTRAATAEGQRAGSLAIANKELQKFIPNVQYWGQQVRNTGFASFNAAANRWKAERGDPAYQHYVAAMNEAMAAYSQALTRGGTPTDAARAQAREVLDPNKPIPGMLASLQEMSFGAGVAEAAPYEAIQDLQNPPGMPAPPRGDTWTPDAKPNDPLGIR